MITSNVEIRFAGYKGEWYRRDKKQGKWVRFRSSVQNKINQSVPGEKPLGLWLRINGEIVAGHVEKLDHSKGTGEFQVSENGIVIERTEMERRDLPLEEFAG